MYERTPVIDSQIQLTTISFIIFVAVIDELTRKESILKEAARLFRVMGYPATSMRDLAGAVGMEAASLYNHISNKQELLKTICMDIAERHSAGLSEVKKMDVTSFGKISALVRNHIQINTTVPEMAAVAHDQWRHLDETTRQQFLEKRNEYERTLKKWIDEAIAERALQAYDTNVILYTLLSSLQWLHHWYRQERPIKAEEIELEMVNLLFNGLNKQ